MGASMTLAFSTELRLVACASAETYAAVALAALEDGGLPGLLPVLGGPQTAERLRRMLPPGIVAARAETAVPPIATGGAVSPLDQLAARADVDADQVLLVERDTPEAAPAAFYAAATGRRLVQVGDLSAFPRSLAGSKGALVSGPAARFDKEMLARLLDWVQVDPASPGSLGLLTARDATQLSCVVAKLLVGRMRHAVGQYLPGPDDSPHPERDAGALEYDVIGAHGNEIHLGFRQDSVLCGRRADLEPRAAGFDCGRGCVLNNRVDAATLSATTMFLMSCDAFAPAEGIAPSDFSLLFRLLDGPTAAVLAPYKHIQANQPLMTLIRALAESGYPLGEIAYILNARGNGGVLPDYGFLVIGDPDLRVTPPTGATPETVTAIETDRGHVIRGDLRAGTKAVTITLPHAAEAGAQAVLPISANTRAENGFFLLGQGGGGRLDVTLFREEGFDPGPLEFALMPMARVPDRVIDEGLTALRQTRLIEEVFGRDAGYDAALENLRAFLDMAVTSPRPIEWMAAQQRMLLADVSLSARLAQVRACVADLSLSALATRRVWISQDYTTLYGDVRRAGPACDHACLHCGNRAVVWRYKDPITRLPDRDVSICNRCGIVSDVPTRPSLVAEMATLGRVTQARTEVEVTLTNRSDRPMGGSMALQVNAFEEARVQSDGGRLDLQLAPGERQVHRVTLIFPETMPDDIMSVQLFLIDDDLALSFYSQKIRAMIRASAPSVD